MFWNRMGWRFVLKRCGDDLFSIAVESPADAQALAAQLRESADCLEVIPGIDSVVVRFDAASHEGGDVQRTIENVVAGGIEPLSTTESLVDIPVVYGGDYGPDLGDLSRETGLSEAELITLHTGGEYTVDMIGFTPGFAFIGGLDDCFHVPRRSEPRQRVAAGSIGIADGRTGLYAMASPGGWNIIGRTPSRLFDPNSDNPFILSAGMRVRFKAIDASDFES